MSARVQPNIIFFFTDQQRWDTVGCYGQPLPITPNLDRLAAEGVRFEYAFTPQPVCGPARACLQTGRYATETGCYVNDIALDLKERTIAHQLSAAGYEVGYLGKWHLASTGARPGKWLPPGREPFSCRTEPIPPERRGGYKDFWLASDVLEHTSHGYDGHMFDAGMRKVEFKGYRVGAVTDFALDYLRTRDRRRPFFLFVSYLEPHHQNDRNRYEGPEDSRKKWKDFSVPGDLAGLPGDWREQYPDYLGCIHSLDANLGRLRAELERLGLAKDTLLLYSSDHGSHFRTRNKEYKRSCHDASIRVPLVAWGPGFSGGRVAEGFASLLDVPSTILRAGGAEPLPGMRGRALQDAVVVTPSDWRQDVFVQISEAEVGRAVRTPRWTYSARSPHHKGAEAPASDLYVETYLYDLQRDPHQRDNLVADPSLAGVRGELRARLLTYIRAVEGQTPEIQPAG